jgi:hypothetical protein
MFPSIFTWKRAFFRSLFIPGPFANSAQTLPAPEGGLIFASEAGV